MTWVYVLSKKSDVAETVKTDWLPMVERQQDRLVKAIRTDRGGEFLSKEFSLWLKKNGIRHSLTMPYSPAMNGIAERANRTITETARGLLIETGLPDYFWPDAVRSACVAKNRALTHVGADKWVPYVEWIGRKPKMDMLRVFGCMCMALVHKHLRHNKLGAKAIWAVHLGMAQNSKGWLLWDPFTKKFLVSRDCKFMENLMYKDWKAENEAKISMRFGEVKSSGLEHVELPLELSSGSTTTRQSSIVNGGEEAKDAEEEEEEVQQVSECAPTLPSRTTSAPRIRVTPQQRQGLHVPAAEEEGRGKRRIQAPNRLTYDALGKQAKSALAGAALMVGEDEESDYEECAFAFFSPVEMPGEPATLKEALESSDAEEWKQAMESELKSIEENGTWELVELPEGRKAITSKWLFKIKGVAAVKPAAPVARETVAPVAREPVAPVAREPVAPVARGSVAPAAQTCLLFCFASCADYTPLWLWGLIKINTMALIKATQNPAGFEAFDGAVGGSFDAEDPFARENTSPLQHGAVSQNPGFASFESRDFEVHSCAPFSGIEAGEGLGAGFWVQQPFGGGRQQCEVLRGRDCAADRL
ncbi:unnamed protein product [Closterium sp. NIES-53]